MNINLIKFLTKLKNASLSRKETILVEYNKLHLELVKVLYSEGLIQSFSIEVQTSFKTQSSSSIKIILRYFYNKPVLKNLKFFSKPSHIKYVKYSDVCKIVDKKFNFFLSTSEGILTSLDCKKKKVGGKLLFMC
jgi:small subunit ribosomal protein S8